MSREIARAIIEDKLNELPCDCISEPDGKEYQVETAIGGDVRVIVAVDGPGISAFKPLIGAFVMSADDSLVAVRADRSRTTV